MGISAALGSSALLPAGLGFRNMVINGHMRIAQRGTSAVSTNDSFPVDRWKVSAATTGAWTMQQISASTTACPAGFDYSIKFTKTTGNTPAAGDYNYAVQYIEGNNCAQLDWGTANAKPAVLSFWVRSGATGTFGGTLRNGASTFYAYPFSYTVNAVDTWEYKIIYIPGITSGTWSKDTSTGIALFFDLGSGANARGTAGSVVSGNYVGASSTSQYPTTTSGGNIFFTGVQLEQNYQPTPFEQRPIGVELQLCQRYYMKWASENASGRIATGIGVNTTVSNFLLPYKVQPRTTLGTLSVTGNYGTSDTAAYIAGTAMTRFDVVCSDVYFAIQVTVASGGTQYRPYFLESNNGTLVVASNMEL